MAFNGEIYEIFSWLPAKLLYEISSKSKHCAEFLSEIQFLEKQCRNSFVKSDEYVLIRDDFSSYDKPEYLQVCALSSSNKNAKLSSREINDLKDNGRVLASGNGLLLCRTFDYSTKLFLCNPTTKDLKYIDLPSEDTIEEWNNNINNNNININNNIININNSWVVFICGKNYCDKQLKSKFPLDYTVLLFNNGPGTWSNYRDVYVVDESGNSNWVLLKENLYIGPGNVDFEKPVHCTDGLYFLSDAGFMVRNGSNRCFNPYYLLHYDIQRGTSRILALPDEAQDENIKNSKMGIFGWEKNNLSPSCYRSICLVKIICLELITIWTLDIDKIDPTKSTWQKSSVIDKSIVHDFGIKDFIPWNSSFGIVEKNLIFFAGEYIYRCCLENDVFEPHRIFKVNESNVGVQLKFEGYSSTLRPCNNSNICRVV